MNAIADLDRRAELAALVRLRHELAELARHAYIVEQIAAAAPTLELEVAPLKTAIGRAWQQMELAQAAMPFDQVRG